MSDKVVEKKVQAAPKVAKVSKGKKSTSRRFIIDCTKPANEGIIGMENFSAFLQKKIKVAGKAGNLGNAVKVTLGKTKITIQTNIPTFKKRYIKYLTKKFLKKNMLRDWLRVVAAKNNVYELRYFNIQGMDEAEE